MEAATALIEFLKRGLVQLFEQELATSKLEAYIQKILRIVREAGGRTSRRNLQRKASIDAASFQLVMKGLVQDGRLKESSEPTSKGQTSLIVSLGDDDE